MNDPFPKDDPLWDVLGRAKEAPDGPRLAERVLRSIRTAPDRRKSHGLLRWGLATAAALIVAATIFIPREHPAASADELFIEAAGLDTLVASSAGWTWSEVAPVDQF